MMERERRPDRGQTYGIAHQEPEQATWDHEEQYASHGPRMIYTGQIPAVEEEWVDADKRPPTASELAYGDARGNKPARQAIGPAAAQDKQPTQTGEVTPHDKDYDRKVVLARQAYDFGYDTFLTFQNEADVSIKLLDTVDVPKTDTTKQLIAFAASALLGGAAGAAAGWFLGAITTAGLAGKAAATASSLVSGAVKSALTSGDAVAAASLADIRQAFSDTFHVQLDVARRDYVGHQDQLGAALTVFGVDQLQLLVDALKAQSPAGLRKKMRHETFLAWTNFLARAKHGEMRAWDYWTENGSPGAIATSAAETKPSAGGLDHSNIKPNNNSPLLENTQRPMQDDAFGVLEIFVDTTGKHVINHPGYRMRLDNVGPKVREEFRTAGKVRELKINKVVHMCTSVHNGVRVDPPTSIASVMITADGYVRASNWSELQKMHFEPKKGPIWDPTGFHDCMDNIIDGNETPDCHLDRKAMAADIAAFANAAQELPLTWLEA